MRLYRKYEHKISQGNSTKGNTQRCKGIFLPKSFQWTKKDKKMFLIKMYLIQMYLVKMYLIKTYLIKMYLIKIYLIKIYLIKM